MSLQPRGKQNTKVLERGGKLEASFEDFSLADEPKIGNGFRLTRDIECDDNSWWWRLNLCPSICAIAKCPLVMLDVVAGRTRLPAGYTEEFVYSVNDFSIFLFDIDKITYCTAEE